MRTHRVVEHPVDRWLGLEEPGFRAPSVAAQLRQLFENAGLLYAWTWRIIRGRYQQSVLGGLWAVVQPAATVAILTVVFTRFITVDTGGVPYVLFSFATIVPWTLLSASLADMVSSLVDHLGLVTKIYFPREVLPLAALLARLVDFGIAFLFVAALLAYYRTPVSASVWAWLPVILLTQLALVAGLGLAGAALNVFVRDVRHLVTLGLQVWFYASPVLYPASAMPGRLRWLLYANPMAGILESYRSVLVRNEAPGLPLAAAAVSGVVALLVGYRMFKRGEVTFADVV
jgi:ABC-type polysaccharide/polyol phosphate export permease